MIYIGNERFFKQRILLRLLRRAMAAEARAHMAKAAEALKSSWMSLKFSGRPQFQA